MSDTLSQDTLVHQRLRASSSGLLWLGLAMSLVGVAAIVFPMISTLVATLLVGWTFIIAGGLMFAGAFSIHGTGPFFGALLIGLITVVAGAFLVFNPLAGAVALTIVIAFIFMIEGAVELAFALEIRPHAGWVGMLISALASIILALVIAAGLPGISVIVLGILLGINFLTTGFGYVFVSRMLQSKP
jgi:uncharacterized membrane protein HdeD (DUF308 family)